jgi:hypothetical protein
MLNCLYLRLLPRRGGEADLRSVVSSTITRGSACCLTRLDYRGVVVLAAILA